MASNDDTDEPAYTVALGGVASDHEPIEQHNQDEYITFDFMVNLSETVLSEDEHLIRAIQQSVDCKSEQITDLVLSQSSGTKKISTRIKGKIYTDDWELPLLQKKFESIVSEHLLSTNLQTLCGLDDRPMVRRFFSRTSREVEKRRESKLDGLSKEDSLRKPLEEDIVSSTAAHAQVSQVGLDRNVTPITKTASKGNESLSVASQSRSEQNNSATEAGQARTTNDNASARGRSERDLDENEQTGFCECANYCVVL